MADSQGGGGSGLPGTFRLLAVVAVAALGVLAALLLLDVIPREMFREAAAKGLGIIAIIAVAAGAIGLIMRSK